MKNIHILPTPNLSRLGFDSVKNLHFVNDFIDDYQHIYITNDKEIKEGDWYLYCNQINKRIRKNPKAEYPYPSYQKIILTTDQDLIKDGVQDIDDEFLEWFVKNPSCEFVKVEVDLSKHNGEFQTKYGYKIIIMKQEQSTKDRILSETLDEVKQWVRDRADLLVNKQETLEEAAKRIYPSDGYFDEIYCDIGDYDKGKWIEGAKWQQERSYSQLDVIRILSKYETLSNEDFNKWFEQFKKK